MVHLNKNQLQDGQIDKLFTQLAHIIEPKRSSHVDNILTEILGREEKIMIGKRLAVIILASEGMSAYKISRTLKLSESTVSVIIKRLEQNEYDTIEKALGRSKRDYFTILSTLDNILHLGGILPHYNGLERYSNLGRN